MVSQLQIFMKLIMQPYAPPKTMQASIFGGRSVLLFSPPKFHLMILLLSMQLALNILLSLVRSPRTHEKLVILGLMPNIVTHETSNVTKELRNINLIFFVEPVFIPCMCLAINSPMAKIIAREIITIKRTIIPNRWRSSLHACLM